MPEQKYMGANEFAEKFYKISSAAWNASSWFRGMSNSEVLYKVITGQMQMPLTLNDDNLKFTEEERALYDQIKMAKSDQSPEAQNFLRYAEVLAVISTSRVTIPELYALIQMVNNGILNSKSAYMYLRDAYRLVTHNNSDLNNAAGPIIIALLQSPQLSIQDLEDIAVNYIKLPQEVRQQLLDSMLKKLADLVEEFVQELSGVPNPETVNLIQGFSTFIADFAIIVRGGYSAKSREYATLTELAEQVRHDYTPEKLYGMGPDFIQKHQESLEHAAAAAKSELQSVRGQISEKDARIAELERQLHERDQELNTLRTENRSQNDELHQLKSDLQRMQAEYEKQIDEIKRGFEQDKAKTDAEQERLMKILEMKIGMIKAYLISFDKTKRPSLTRGNDLTQIGESFKVAMYGNPTDPESYNWIKDMETMLAKRKTEQMQHVRI